MNKKPILIVLGVLVLSIGGYKLYELLKPKKEVICLNGQTEIYEKYKNAVVLVKHTYAVSFSIKGSKPIYIEFEDNNFLEQTITGTGFFVSDDGKIVTNHHVAEPWLYDTGDMMSSEYMKEHIAEILPDSIPESQYKTYLEQNWDTYYDEGEEYDETEDASAETTTDTTATTEQTTENIVTEEATTQPEIKMVSVDDIEIITATKEISVALHNTNDEWLKCKVIKISTEQDVDIAVLQLESKTLPSEVTNVIDLETAVLNDNTLQPGTKAILIGYPMGMTLANTRRGIKVQVYEGQINKETDGVSIQYNITSTHGASGSPVFNECGQLIAVNYAGFDEAQGYNFGIVAKYAKKLAN